MSLLAKLIYTERWAWEGGADVPGGPWALTFALIGAVAIVVLVNRKH